jgi:type IV secretory pathway VirB10-like protein
MTLVELNDHDEKNINPAYVDREKDVKAKPLFFIDNEIDSILASNENVNEKLKKYFYALNRFLFFKNQSEILSPGSSRISNEDKTKVIADSVAVLDEKPMSNESNGVEHEKPTTPPWSKREKSEKSDSEQNEYERNEEKTPKQKRKKKTPKSVRTQKKKKELDSIEARVSPFTVKKQLLRTPIKTRSQTGEGNPRVFDAMWLKF